ncbi:Pentatricopeptide repeat-containing protein [Diplonema papillatum]|nr:Pentatricopeptide repeat-containing protein [Diplonema papillatum]
MNAMAAVTTLWNGLPDEAVGSYSYIVFIRFLGGLKRWRAVDTLLSEMQARRVRGEGQLFNRLIQFEADRGRVGFTRDWSRVARIYSNMLRAGFSPDRETYAAVLQVCTKWRSASAAMKVLSLMKDEGIEISSGGVATVVAVSEDVRSALLVAAAFPECLNTTVFNAVMSISSRQGDIASCWKTFNTLSAAGHTPTDRTFSILLNAYKEACDLPGFLNTMQLAVEKYQYDSDEITYTMLVTLCEKLLEREEERQETCFASVVRLAVDVFEVAVSRKKHSSLRLAERMFSLLLTVGDVQSIERVARAFSSSGVDCSLILRRQYTAICA